MSERTPDMNEMPEMPQTGHRLSVTYYSDTEEPALVDTNEVYGDARIVVHKAWTGKNFLESMDAALAGATIVIWLIWIFYKGPYQGLTNFMFAFAMTCFAVIHATTVWKNHKNKIKWNVPLPLDFFEKESEYTIDVHFLQGEDEEEGDEDDTDDTEENDSIVDEVSDGTIPRENLSL